MAKLPRDVNNVETLVSWLLGPWVTCTQGELTVALSTPAPHLSLAHCCLASVLQSKWSSRKALPGSSGGSTHAFLSRQGRSASLSLYLSVPLLPFPYSPHLLLSLQLFLLLLCPGVHVFSVWRIILLHACFHSPSLLSFSYSPNPLSCSKNLGLWTTKTRQMHSVFLPSTPS